MMKSSLLRIFYDQFAFKETGYSFHIPKHYHAQGDVTCTEMSYRYQEHFNEDSCMFCSSLTTIEEEID